MIPARKQIFIARAAVAYRCYRSGNTLVIPKKAMGNFYVVSSGAAEIGHYTSTCLKALLNETNGY